MVLATVLLVAGCSRSQQHESAVKAPAPTSADTIEYVAHGNEPFWSITVSSRGELLYQTPENIDGARGPATGPTREGSRLVFRAKLDDNPSTPVELALDEQPCQDSMSGLSFAYTATARVGDRVLQGCGEPRPAAPLGDWKVGGHRIPGVSAMKDSGAMAWHGRSARFTTGMAVFDDDTCHTPTYDTRDLRGDSLLAVDYRADPAVFGLRPGAAIRRIEIRCGDSPWSGPGGVLFVMPSGTLFTVWDGVFFELRRNAPSP